MVTICGERCMKMFIRIEINKGDDSEDTKKNIRFNYRDRGNRK